MATTRAFRTPCAGCRPKSWPSVPSTPACSRAWTPRNGRLPLHIDVNATDRDQDAELERLLAAGAERVDIGQTGQEPWYVLADPEGNEFCLLRPRVDPV
ncbi:VOC family protein [Nocardiopsis sp. CA-288880]|uniref:VOC family protein n=1 Tax=Nocardiopsis sp. CA-288880 TaxID=3239995 RepID=UPI003D97CE78